MSYLSPSFFSFFIIFKLLLTCTSYANGCYTSVINFGDSLTDTGNLKHLSFQLNLQPAPFFYLPYGETFFHKATGRASNGRLIIDFIAESLQLPFVPPFFDEHGSQVMELGQGVNYAVIGAATLDSSIYEAIGIYNKITNASLRIQLEWFKQSICVNVSDCSHKIGGSLILMSMTGINDYIGVLSGGKSIDEVERYVPFVVKALISVINELIELGAKAILVSGVLPMGCFPFLFKLHNGFDKMEYDNLTGCLIQLNELAEYHNELLVTELNKVRELHPDANIIYADVYNAAMQFYRSPKKYGFTNGALKPCLGFGGALLYNEYRSRRGPSLTVCDQPDTYVSWDGCHLTEAAYKIITKSLLQGPYTVPQFNSYCATSMSKEIDGLSTFM